MTCLFEMWGAVLEYVGSVPRLRNERAGHVRFSDDGGYIACLAAGKGCEVFRVRSPEEVKKKVHRRKKRLREKGKEKGGVITAFCSGLWGCLALSIGGDAEAVDGDADAQDEPLAQDELELWGYILAEHKLRSLAFLPTPSGSVSPILTVRLDTRPCVLFVWSQTVCRSWWRIRTIKWWSTD